MKKLLIKGASAWELDKSRISDTLEEKFFALNSISVKNPPIKYKNVLLKSLLKTIIWLIFIMMAKKRP